MTLLYTFFWIDIVTLGAALARVSQAREDVSLLRWGLILIVVGLLSLVFSHDDDWRISGLHAQHNAEMIRTFFVLISGIGANLVASSAIANFNQPAPKPVRTKWLGSIWIGRRRRLCLAIKIRRSVQKPEPTVQAPDQ